MATPPTRGQRWRKRARYRHTTWLIAAVAALVVGGGAAGGVWLSQRDDDGLSVDAGDYVPPSDIFPSAQPPETSSTTKAKKSPSSTPTASPTSSSASAAQKSSTSPAAIAQQAPAGEPTRVQVSSGGRSIVDASLEATKLDSEKVLAPPFGTAGWYAEPGWPKPGHDGASILVGHINHGSKPDVFWNLPQVKVGDVVTVTYGSGKEVQFKINKSEAATKSGVPQDDSIWDYDNPDPVLRLITCDPGTPLSGGHYEGNWVVWADQLSS